MKPVRFCIFLVFAFLSVLVYGQEKPNIILILADDQAPDTISALGHPHIKTPNLDRLVEAGTTFTNAYSQGANQPAVCVPSRTMLNTGRFLWRARNRVTEISRQMERTPEQAAEHTSDVWSSLMRQGGYTTYFVGKWHVQGFKVQDVFEHLGTIRGGMPPSMDLAYNRPREGANNPWTPYESRFQGHWHGGKHWAEVFSDESVRFIEEAAAKSEPFFMYLASNSPHDPRQAPKEYVDMYPVEDMDVPANFLPEYPHKDVMGCPSNLRDERLAPFPRTELAVRTHRREYYAIISHLDSQVGQILDALEKSGKKNSTYIFYTADQGLAVGAHGLFGKQNMFEHSMKSPLIVVGPGIPGKKKIETPVYLQDIMPTSLEVAGMEIPKHVQFKSLLPLINGERDEQYEAIYGAYMDRQRMVRKGDFKLILYPQGDVQILYDLKNDPHETTDLAKKPEYADKITELQQELARLKKETGDPVR